MAKRFLIAAQLLCWAAFFALYWFAAHKMGVQRHVMAQNFYWPKAVPLATLQWGGWVVLTLCTFLISARSVRPMPVFYGLLGLAALVCPPIYRPTVYNQGLCLLAAAWGFALVGSAGKGTRSRSSFR